VRAKREAKADDKTAPQPPGFPGLSLVFREDVYLNVFLDTGVL